MVPAKVADGMAYAEQHAHNAVHPATGTFTVWSVDAAHLKDKNAHKAITISLSMLRACMLGFATFVARQALSSLSMGHLTRSAIYSYVLPAFSNFLSTQLSLRLRYLSFLTCKSSA
jgi:hypothetical protein